MYHHHHRFHMRMSDVVPPRHYVRRDPLQTYAEFSTRKYRAALKRLGIADVTALESNRAKRSTQAKDGRGIGVQHFERGDGAMTEHGIGPGFIGMLGGMGTIASAPQLATHASQWMEMPGALGKTAWALATAGSLVAVRFGSNASRGLLSGQKAHEEMRRALRDEPNAKTVIGELSEKLAALVRDPYSTTAVVAFQKDMVRALGVDSAAKALKALGLGAPTDVLRPNR
jgi:hypothetical protein